MYKRLWTWISHNEGEKESTSPSVFTGFPIELYAEVFQYLDVESLKKCKEVCFRWHTVLSLTEILCQNAVTIWNGKEMGSQDYFKKCFQLIFDKIHLEDNYGLRLKEFESNGFSMVSGSIEEHSFFQFLTHVEITNTQLDAVHLTEMVSKAKNLISLDLNDVRLIDAGFPQPPTPDIYIHWEKIKSLKIYVAENWEINTIQPLTSSIIGTYCTRLENLTVKIFDTGARLVDQMRPFQNVFRDFFNTVHANAITLKTVALDTFNLEFDRDDKFYPKSFEGVDESHHYTFQWFLTSLAEHTDWEDCGLKLEKLNLRFRLVNTRNTRAQTTILPFLRTQTSLKEFKMAQVYLPVDENTLEVLLACVPPFCHSMVEGVLTIRPALAVQVNNLEIVPDGNNPDVGENDNAVPPVAQVQPPLALDVLDLVPVVPQPLGDGDAGDDNDDFDDEDEPDSDEEPDSDDDNGDNNADGVPALLAPNMPHVNLPWQIHVQVEYGKPQPLLEASNFLANILSFLEKIIDPQLPQPIRQNRSVVSSGYYDSSVELKTAGRSLTLRFLRCRSLNDVNFLTRNMKLLTQIKIQEIGVKHEHKIMIGDAELQTIITTAMSLKDLWLEFCDLHGLTDYGLTGIGSDACLKMLETKDFELRLGDLVGVPISSMQNLRSLKLSDVGNQITDVSAYHAFNGLHSLSHFGISHPKMTSDGFKKIRDLFKFNQIVQIDIRTKILMDQFAPPDPSAQIERNQQIVPY